MVTRGEDRRRHGQKLTCFAGERCVSDRATSYKTRDSVVAHVNGRGEAHQPASIPPSAETQEP